MSLPEDTPGRRRPAVIDSFNPEMLRAINRLRAARFHEDGRTMPCYGSTAWFGEAHREETREQAAERCVNAAVQCVLSCPFMLECVANRKAEPHPHGVYAGMYWNYRSVKQQTKINQRIARAIVAQKRKLQ